MHPRFSIAVDRPRNLVTIVMTGLFQPADVDAFFAARHKAHAKLSCAPGRHVTLTDMRTMSIMPRETVEAFTTLLTHPQSRARRLAFVIPPTLVRSQVLRALASRSGRFFEDVAEAECWLLEEDETAREAAFGRPTSGYETPLLRSFG
jgi:hypothetical protein